jgi:hypothetical protein
MICDLAVAEPRSGAEIEAGVQPLAAWSTLR